ncbi:hypothetical protein FGG08_007328 [Glutinoglossum americanum]|uniref:ATP synthase subunit K, mitochondrial n=1 Tax=Glutinoglossum americanum TaxID=1670608 RepID=A0A9P8KU24_9PEZI|nr:hypothetical protein FGG08_007328 [Glutinoglossum americanum]
MVVQYTIAGRQVGSHILAIATLGLTGVLSYVSLRSSSSDAAVKAQGPPIKASSADEESFIKEFLKNAEKEENTQKH